MKEEDIRKREVFNQYLKMVEEDVKKIFGDERRFSAIDCPACHSNNLEHQFKKIGFSYVLCKNCGTLFANPRPFFEDLNKFYTESDSTTFWVEKFFKPVAEVRREKIFKPRAEFIANRFSQNRLGTVGDIGAGFGIFLEELIKLQPEIKAVAIESSIEMAEICRKKKIEVIPSAVENISGWDGKFDLLTSFELFEHLYDPGLFLEKAYDLLRPGGYLFLSTLNGEGFDIQILWEKSKSIAPPQHLNFFNPDSIKILLESKRFIVKEATTPGKLDWNIVEGMYSQEGVSPGRLWELIARKAGSDAKNKLQSWIAENNFSSHMQILCQKPVL